MLVGHIRMCLSVLPKLSIAFAIGFLKGKSVVRIHREISNKRRMTGLHFLVRGYGVSMVGWDEKVVRKYIRDKEAIEKRQMELELK